MRSPFELANNILFQSYVIMYIATFYSSFDRVKATETSMIKFSKKTSELIKGIRKPGNTVLIDFSSQNPVFNELDMEDTDAFEKYIFDFIQSRGAKYAIGGYLENRSCYRRSEIFKSDEGDYRNIHLGVDIWAPAGTAVYAPLDGIVHRLADNQGKGDYGPTIILQHLTEQTELYTLYGHLSRKDLKQLHHGQKIQQGEAFATIGESHENGNWVPHLHFQIIKKIGDFLGDYPGVSSEKEIEFYRQNCPDPEIILQLNSK